MHDCRKIEERLIDLVFDELSEDQRKEIHAEVESCSHCRAQVESYYATLTTFDEAASLMMPEENYWNGYEARLRSRLAAEIRPNVQQQWTSALNGFFRQPAWALATVAMILAALFMWAALRLSVTGNEAYSSQNNVVNLADKVLANAGKAVLGTGIQPPVIPKGQNKQVRGGSSHPLERQMIVKREKFRQPENLQSESPASITTEVQASFVASAIDAETMRHFEKTQMLLRSFRNLRPDSDKVSVEIADEKQRSRALLFQNILLRREASAKGFLPVEEVLSNVEPVLIDIANLPDKAPPEEIRAIRERIQKRDIVTTLQVYLSKPAVIGAITD